MLIYLTDQYTKLNLGVILLQTQLRQHLVINKDLAHTYRLVQNEFYTVKNELLDTFEYRVSLESSLKDHKQVCIKFKPLFYSQVKCASLEIQQESKNPFLQRFSSKKATRTQVDSHKLNRGESIDSPNLFCKNLNGLCCSTPQISDPEHGVYSVAWF